MHGTTRDGFAVFLSVEKEFVVPELVGIHIQYMGPREMDLQYLHPEG